MTDSLPDENGDPIRVGDHITFRHWGGQVQLGWVGEKILVVGLSRTRIRFHLPMIAYGGALGFPEFDAAPSTLAVLWESIPSNSRAARDD